MFLSQAKKTRIETDIKGIEELDEEKLSDEKKQTKSKLLATIAIDTKYRTLRKILEELE